MAKEICISSTPHETRLAILEDDQLAEIYYERENEYTLAGSIYNGRVTRVLPGMQSAFVDLGLERDAFLYVTDFLEMEDQEESDELERAATSTPVPQIARESRREREPREGGGEERRERYGREGRRESRPAPEYAPA
ncbi:MAG: ribonuclease, partial [Terracidiphilus sp.]